MENTITRKDLMAQKTDELCSIMGKEMEIAGIEEAEKSPSDLFHDLEKCGYLEITAPEEEKPLLECIVLNRNSGYEKGRSIKPGNIKLNMRKLVESIPAMTALIASIAWDINLLKVCSALTLWKSLRDVSTVDITRDQAIIMVALWQHCNDDHRIKTEKGFEVANSFYASIGDTTISTKKYHTILDQLVRLGCIEIDDDIIWLREWIRNGYS